jgi:hypothetical protein
VRVEPPSFTWHAGAPCGKNMLLDLVLHHPPLPRTLHLRRTNQSTRGRSRRCGPARGGSDPPPKQKTHAKNVAAPVLGTAIRKRGERSFLTIITSVSDGLLPAAKRAPYGAELYIEIGDGAKEAASPPMHGIL